MNWDREIKAYDDAGLAAYKLEMGANVAASNASAQGAVRDAAKATEGIVKAQAEVAGAKEGAAKAVADVEKAKADIAKSNAVAADAKAQVAGAEARAAEAKLETARLHKAFANRQLTPEQHAILMRELSAHPQAFNIESMSDPESGLYAAEIFNTFMESGWHVVEKPSLWEKYGMVLFYLEPPTPQRLTPAL